MKIYINSIIKTHRGTQAEDYAIIDGIRRDSRRGYTAGEIMGLLAAGNKHYIQHLQTIYNYIFRRYNLRKPTSGRQEVQDLLGELYLQMTKVAEERGADFVISEKISLLKCFQLDNYKFTQGREVAIDDSIINILTGDTLDIDSIKDKMQAEKVADIICKDKRLQGYLKSIKLAKSRQNKYTYKKRMLTYIQNTYKDTADF